MGGARTQAFFGARLELAARRRTALVDGAMRGLADMAGQGDAARRRGFRSAHAGRKWRGLFDEVVGQAECVNFAPVERHAKIGAARAAGCAGRRGCAALVLFGRDDRTHADDDFPLERRDRRPGRESSSSRCYPPRNMAKVKMDMVGLRARWLAAGSGRAIRPVRAPQSSTPSRGRTPPSATAIPCA